MKFFYDTEFLDDGKTIGLISIGIVREDAQEYYAVNSEIRQDKVRRHPWLRQNVWPHLPVISGSPSKKAAEISFFTNLLSDSSKLDLEDARVKPKFVIANEVRQFLLSDGGRQPELWAWYSAYDHVVLAQLWGPMVKLPKGIPLRTNDLKQEYERFGDPAAPEHTGDEHNALDDARHVRDMYYYLLKHHASKGG